MTIFSGLQPHLQKWEKYRQSLYYVAYSWCHDEALASDLVQETLTRGWKNRNQLKESDAEKTWLFTILKNCWKDHWRKHQSMNDIDDVEMVEENGPFYEHHREQTLSRIRSAMSKLNKGQREVLSLVAIDGASYDEVAKILNIPKGTVMSRLCRARSNLKKKFQDIEMDSFEKKVSIRRVK